MYRTIITFYKKGFVLFNVTLFSIFFITNTFSQTFEKSHRTEEDDISYDAISLEENFIFVVNSGNIENSNYHQKCFKLDEYGNFVDSVSIPFYGNIMVSDLSNLFKINDSIILLINKMNNNSLQFVHLTPELNIVYNSILDTLLDNQYFDIVYTQDSLIVCVGATEILNKFCLMETDKFGNIINYKTYESYQSGYLPSTIEYIPSRNVYHMFIYWSNDEVFYEINKETLELDTILHYPDAFLPRNAINGFSNDRYFLAGKQGTGTIWKLSYIEMNKFGETLMQKIFLPEHDSDVFYSYNSFDTFNNSIFYGGTYHVTYSPPFFLYPEKRWIFVSKVNANGSIIWQHFYKGDVNYMTYKVLATSDGGALILSTKYDWNDPIPNQRDLHILKVDSTGWYEGMTTGNTEYDLPKQILVYPNPAKDKVSFVTGLYSNLELKIYNLQGSCVIKRHLPHTQTIDLSGLPPGTYIYLITGKDGFKEKGKLIKQ